MQYLAAAAEAVVVVRCPVGAVGVVLPLEEAGVGVLLQLLGVPHVQTILRLALVCLRPAPKLTVIRHVHLQRERWERGRGEERSKER